MARCPRVVEGERQPERRVGMDAATDRIGLFGEEGQVPRHDRVHQRLQVPRPLPAFRVVPAAEFLGQLQQPGPAVGPLEGLVVRLGEVVGLDLEVLGGQMFARTTRICRLSGRSGNNRSKRTSIQWLWTDECQSKDP